ncbi:MAG: glycosyltransferase family 4 protein, partial [Marinirhabdus sp.]|nr:glycosyltransferase family 4 protein [Marinirhabdus sp.]
EHIAKAMNAKMGVSFRGFDINVYPIRHPNCYKRVWQNVDKVHSISNYLHEKALGYGLPSELPYARIPPAVVIDNLPNTTESNSEILQITTIARLSWIKGIDVALSAMQLLKASGVKIQYHIIGDGIQKEWERYQFQVYEQELQDEVVFHGKLSHAETLTRLAATDLYVQSSWNEGFCNAVLEAQALGKLVIVSNVGGLPENIEDGQTGWLFPVGDAHALAHQIQYCLELPKSEKEKVAKQAQQRVRQHFNIEKQQREFVSFYTEAL